MQYKAIVSGHIWSDDSGRVGIEILRKIDNDHEGVHIFDDMEDALLDEIDTGNSNSYYFIAIVNSKFVEYPHWEGIEYGVEHEVTEVNSIGDLL